MYPDWRWHRSRVRALQRAQRGAARASSAIARSPGLARAVQRAIALWRPVHQRLSQRRADARQIDRRVLKAAEFQHIDPAPLRRALRATSRRAPCSARRLNARWLCERRLRLAQPRRRADPLRGALRSARALGPMGAVRGHMLGHNKRGVSGVVSGFCVAHLCPKDSSTGSETTDNGH